MPFTQGAPSFGLNDCKIATWTAAGSYGTLVDVMSVQMMGVTMQQVNAQLTGDDRITATAARAIGGTVQVRFGGINIEALEILTGKTGTTISSVEQLMIVGGDRMPYVGLIGKALVEEGSGDIWVYVPKAKIMSDFTIAMMEYGAFAIPEVTLQLVDDEDYGIINLITHPTDVAITVMPPANIAAIA